MPFQVGMRTVEPGNRHAGFGKRQKMLLPAGRGTNGSYDLGVVMFPEGGQHTSSLCIAVSMESGGGSHWIGGGFARRVVKSNRFIRSPIAGALLGTYGLPDEGIGLGRLSRVRTDNGGSCQFRSINFDND